MSRECQSVSSLVWRMAVCVCFDLSYACQCLTWSLECQSLFAVVGRIPAVSIFDLMYVCQGLQWPEECQSVSALVWRMPVCVCLWPNVCVPGSAMTWRMLVCIRPGLKNASLCLPWSEECQSVSVFDLMYVCQCLPWSEEWQSVSALAWSLPVFVSRGRKDISLCLSLT